MEIEDRFGHWRSEQAGQLIWALGAMAAEHVFYGQNTTGVGGDVQSVTYLAARMVGVRRWRRRRSTSRTASRTSRSARRPSGA